VSAGTGPFSEAAPYYVFGRPPYSAELLPTVLAAAGLAGTGHLLDVGCGPGLLTLELAPGFTAVTALDPEPTMLAEAAARAAAAGITHVRWVEGVAEDLPATGIGARGCDLVTFGQSYHWTAGVPVLDSAYDLVADGGALALIGHRVQGRAQPAPPRNGLPRIPEDEIRALIAHYIDDGAAPLPAGATNAATPSRFVDDVAASRFGGSTIVYAPGRADVVRDIESVVAGYYSTSFAAPSRFGPRKAAFESALRAVLRRHAPDGLFWDWPGDTEIVLATR